MSWRGARLLVTDELALTTLKEVASIRSLEDRHELIGL